MSDERSSSSVGPPTRPTRPWLRYVQWAMIVAALAVVMMQWPLYKSIGMGLLNIDPPDDGIGWRTDFDTALVEAEQVGKPVLVNFTADWCGPCVAMKRDVWPRDGVREAVLAGYVPVRLDVDEAEGQRVGVRYDVQAIPTSIVLDADGQELDRVNYATDSQMQDWLAAARGPHD